MKQITPELQTYIKHHAPPHCDLAKVNKLAVQMILKTIRTPDAQAGPISPGNHQAVLKANISAIQRDQLNIDTYAQEKGYGALQILARSCADQAIAKFAPPKIIITSPFLVGEYSTIV